MSRIRLSEEEVTARLPELHGWELRDGKLHRLFKFKNFTEAFAFMTASALQAEKLGHHPDWRNIYATVSVDLWTHDVNGITDLDFKLALAMNALALKLS
ncbi:MAG: 4a-hydroxytetrahydrobiopterin dehydratase [Verrucomicrobiales bacterium]|jgi:4a-hydroxytetrahydrobiopterin dehydratase|nr:4a-hydroxytetrahydrobiopterin dehydratase [Verrucomicrobiales bacterium]